MDATPIHALVQARKAAGLTQSELACLVGTSQAMISRYESEVTTPRPATMRRLMTACGEHRRRASDLLAEHRDEVLGYLYDNGFSNVRVFGSVARGDDTADSDVDLLVDYPPGIGLSLFGVGADLEEILTVHVDMCSEKELKRLVKPRVMAEAVPL